MNDGTNHPVFRNPLGTENTDNRAESIPQSLLDENEKQFQNLLITKDGEPDCIPLSTNINLKCKKRMLHFPLDFGDLTIDGLIDTGALSSAIPEMDLRKSAFYLLNLSSGKVRLRTSKSWSLMGNWKLPRVP